MKLEDQVCNIDLAKRLKELGVNQESHFYWAQLVEDEITPRSVKIVPMDQWRILDHQGLAANLSAFTVAELGEMIPASVKQTTIINEKQDSAHIFFIRYDDDDSDCDGTNPTTCIKTKWHAECGRKKIRELTEADARAKMLIYLLENKLVTV